MITGTIEKPLYQQGATWHPRLTLTRISDKQPVDLSGHSVEWCMHRKAGGSPLVILPITGSHDSAGGHLDVDVPPTTTVGVSPGEYIGEWKWWTGSGSAADTKIFQYPITVKESFNP